MFDALFFFLVTYYNLVNTNVPFFPEKTEALYSSIIFCKRRIIIKHTVELPLNMLNNRKKKKIINTELIMCLSIKLLQDDILMFRESKKRFFLQLFSRKINFDITCLKLKFRIFMKKHLKCFFRQPRPHKITSFFSEKDNSSLVKCQLSKKKKKKLFLSQVYKSHTPCLCFSVYALGNASLKALQN